MIGERETVEATTVNSELTDTAKKSTPPRLPKSPSLRRLVGGRLCASNTPAPTRPVWLEQPRQWKCHYGKAGTTPRWHGLCPIPYQPHGDQKQEGSQGDLLPTLALQRRQAQTVRKVASSHKGLGHLKLKGYQNLIIGSKGIAILLIGWIVPIGGVASGEVCVQPAKQACSHEKSCQTLSVCPCHLCICSLNISTEYCLLDLLGKVSCNLKKRTGSRRLLISSESYVFIWANNNIKFRKIQDQLVISLVPLQTLPFKYSIFWQFCH